MKKVILTSAFALLIAASSFAQKGGLVYKLEKQEPTKAFVHPKSPVPGFSSYELVLFFMENQMFGELANFSNYLLKGNTGHTIETKPLNRSKEGELK